MATIRAGEPTDVDAIAEVHVRSWQEAYRGLLPDAVLDGLSFARRREAWQAILAEEDAEAPTVDVAEEDSRVVGFSHVGPNRDGLGADVGELYAIYLRADHWARGIGHALHERSMRRLADAGYREASLWVLDGNERTVRFYERHGWVADGTERTEPLREAVLHEVRYRRDLTDVAAGSADRATMVGPPPAD